ncbi:MAG: restriction endonuclease subunit S [Methanosarcina barkeri]|nr:restriction endonuclease subunit S [Methanosarcina sp. ERenArc_MAG2]
MIHNLKPYPVYKDSGISWLGEVPEHWEVKRQRNIAQMLVSNINKHSLESEKPVRLCNYVDVYKNERITEYIHFMHATASQEEIKKFRLQVGDVIITKDSEMWNDIGVPALVEYEAPDLVCGYHLAILKPRDDVIIGDYLLRALQSRGVQSQYYISANGVTRYGLSHYAIKSVLVPVPPLPEQSAIVHYLDHIDRRIRRYIRTKQKLIKLLEEQKQAIIYKAVTGGLNPDVKLKPSEVEWLGEVPEHYKRTKLGRLCQSIRDGTHNPPPAVEGEHRLLSVRNIIGGRFVTRNDDRTMTPSAFSDLQRSYTVQENDIVLALVGATTGKSAVVEKMDKVTVQRSIGILRSNPLVLESHFLNFVISSELVQAQIHRVMDKYAAQPGIYLNDVSKLQIVYPELNEQKRIIYFIQKNTQSIDVAIDHAQREISLLREYRTRLIADVVTGKLDVREAAANLPEEIDETEVLDEGLVEDEETTEENLDGEPEEET